jgi:hypothetical protein
MNILNVLLAAIPGNGYKTIIGAILLMVAQAIPFLSDKMELVHQILGILGFSVTGLGLAHKAVKSLDK